MKKLLILLAIPMTIAVVSCTNYSLTKEKWRAKTVENGTITVVTSPIKDAYDIGDTVWVNNRMEIDPVDSNAMLMVLQTCIN